MYFLFCFFGSQSDGTHWLAFCESPKVHYGSSNKSSLMFYWKKKFSTSRMPLRVNKWIAHFHFWVNSSLKILRLFCIRNANWCSCTFVWAVTKGSSFTAFHVQHTQILLCECKRLCLFAWDCSQVFNWGDEICADTFRKGRERLFARLGWKETHR